MPSIYFNDEHDAYRHEVRSFLLREVAPRARAWEAAGRIPREVFVRMGELGFLGITAPEAYGGAGADLFFALAFLEELPRSMMGGFCAAVSVQQFMATPHILRAGSEALKRRYVAESVAGRKVGALAVTEPDAGSDVAAIRTSAARQGDTFVVNGAKTFITNGAEGDFYTVAVRTGNEPGAAGISLLVIDADTPGVRVSSRLAKLGWHCSDTAEIVFENARVPAGHLIGEEQSGFAQLMQSFALERLCAAAIAVGSADVVLEETLRHLTQRQAFGKPLSRFQALRHRLADLCAELEAARQLTYHTAWLLERNEPATREAAMAKLVTTELGKRIADECLQMFGGYGFMEEYPVARFYRDARGATITAGTSEIMREIIARAVVDDWIPAPVVAAAAAAPQPAPAQPAAEAAGHPIEVEIARTTVESLMTSLPARLRADRARGWSGAFHCTIRGAGTPQWTVRIDDGSCSVERGHVGRPAPSRGRRRSPRSSRSGSRDGAAQSADRLPHGQDQGHRPHPADALRARFQRLGLIPQRRTLQGAGRPGRLSRRRAPAPTVESQSGASHGNPRARGSGAGAEAGIDVAMDRREGDPIVKRSPLDRAIGEHIPGPRVRGEGAPPRTRAMENDTDASARLREDWFDRTFERVRGFLDEMFR